MFYAFLKKELIDNPGSYNIERFGADTLNELGDKVDQAKNAGYTLSTAEEWVSQLKQSIDFTQSPPAAE